MGRGLWRQYGAYEALVGGRVAHAVARAYGGEVDVVSGAASREPRGVVPVIAKDMDGVRNSRGRWSVVHAERRLVEPRQGQRCGSRRATWVLASSSRAYVFVPHLEAYSARSAALSAPGPCSKGPRSNRVVCRRRSRASRRRRGARRYAFLARGREERPVAVEHVVVDACDLLREADDALVQLPVGEPEDH